MYIKSMIQNKRPTLKTLVLRGLFIVIGLAVAWVVVVLAVFIFSWHHSNHLNQQRLQTLQNDSILHCQVPQISAWHTEDVNVAGTTHGIGFGGTAPTSVTRDFNLNNANPISVISAFTACAQKDGWTLTQYSDFKRPEPYLEATKVFPGGWMATLGITTELNPSFTGQSIIQLDLETDGV